MNENNSEVARLMHRIDLASEAARLGLYGPAEVAKHEHITAHMMQGAERILQLVQEGKHEEAVALMNSDTWHGEEAAQEAPTPIASSTSLTSAPGGTSLLETRGM